MEAKIIVGDNVIYQNHEGEMSIFDRLTASPQEFTDAQLEQIMRMYEGRQPSIAPARLPALAFVEYERRHRRLPSPT